MIEYFYIYRTHVDYTNYLQQIFGKNAKMNDKKQTRMRMMIIKSRM
ncbi:unnamed protein product [Paramecium sonneborni]|uniref:Uncharacterized protein n=1 Tax=Paramecium sonneborni TaxID=65129 RepID=A0A8S1QPY7_9CILI|nr:unnamed protein product [Paramecium sonneborni]